MTVKEILLEVLYSPRKNPKLLTEHCQIIALAYLKMKVKSGNSFITSLGTTLDDLALDCIADLFERDEQGRFLHFESYFGKGQLSELSEVELQSRLRRLVFSKVNDGLFRNIGIYDMSLSKIIRNLKLAADKQGLSINRVDGDNELLFNRDLSDHRTRPVMPPEFLEIRLTNRLNLNMETPDVLSVLTDIFLEQRVYQQKYPVVQLARIIRRSSINLHDKPKSSTQTQNLTISKEKLNQLLYEAIDGCSECFEKSYIDKGKIDRNTLDKYLNCIRGILHHHYVKDSENGDSYYDHFKEIFPDVSKVEYRHDHRQYLEYMVKTVRQNLFNKVKRVI